MGVWAAWRAAGIVLMAALGGGCSSPAVSIGAHGKHVPAGDGTALLVYTLEQTAGPRARAAGAEPRATVLYVQGSEDTSVTSAIGGLAGLVILGADVRMMERRGVAPGGAVDAALAREGATLSTRVADVRAVLSSVIADLPAGRPLILLGTSEGCDVAARVAASEPRVTHLVLLAGGGGWTQADEFRHFAKTRGARSVGVGSVEELEAKFTDIQARPTADKAWLGHPYARWATFAFESPLASLLSLDIPILVVQGDRDDSVPVESARALRDAWVAAKRTNLKYVEIAGATHAFKDAETGVDLLPRVEVASIQWLRDLGVVGPEEASVFEARVRAAHPEAFGP